MPIRVAVPPRERCVVLVPVGGMIEPACESSLNELEKRGYPVWRVRGYSAIDQGRNQMATDALAAGFAETMWIDSDVGFTPDDIDRLRCLELPLVCAIYPKKGKRELAVHVMPGTTQLVFGQAGGLVELLYAATGFLHVRREVYETIQRELQLPTCNLHFGKGMVPFFQPMVQGGEGRGEKAEGRGQKADGRGEEVRNSELGTGSGREQAHSALRAPRSALPDNDVIRNTRILPGPEFPVAVPATPWYLAEDFAFCERARQCGYKIWADTRVRLTHIGSYAYTWEEAGADPPRFASYTYHIGEK
jgi:hypothetical protein